MSIQAHTAPRLLRQSAWSSVDHRSAGWEFVSFAVEQMPIGTRISRSADDHEIAIVPLSGRITVEAERQGWSLGGRTSVFDGRGECLYLPRDTEAQLTAMTDAEVAVCGARCERRMRPQHIAPGDVQVEVRGAGNATRQIAGLILPNFAADRLLVVEVWTPGGNWSSYPPHKHDDARDGEVVLEETYYFRIARPGGFALQRVYSPAHNFDAAWAVADGDLLLVPWGYHTTCAAHGCDLYYLNVLAGPGAERSLQAFEDPQLAPLRADWETTPTDPRVPLVPGVGSLT